jgi:polyphenol oxidase
MFLTSPLLSASPALKHGFFGRKGGVSGGVYDRLNISYSSRDTTDNVQQNRQRCLVALGFAPETPLATLQQTHSREVMVVDSPYDSRCAPEGDGLVSRTPGLVLGVQTADCAPVLFYDEEAKVIGAAHAGWKGALGGVLEATVHAMQRLGAAPERMLAAIGPCIQQASYEVDAVFYQTVVSEAAAYQTFFKETADPLKFHFNLPAFVRFRLYNLGVMLVDDVECDTVSNPDDFFSFRRATLHAEADYGRELSAIALLPTP